MAEIPNATPSAPPAAPPSPAPSPASPGSGAPAPATPPSTPAPTPPPPPSLDSNQLLEISTPNGPKVMTLGQMAEIVANAPDGFSAEELEELRTIRDAAKGNPEAWAKLRARSGEPAAPPPAPDPRDQEIAELKQQVARVLPVAEGIQNVQRETNMRAVIDGMAEQLPWLAHNPDRARLALDEIHKVRQEAVQRGMDVDRMGDEVRAQIVRVALDRVNSRIETQLRAYGVTTPPKRAGQPGPGQTPTASPAGLPPTGQVVIGQEPDSETPLMGAGIRVLPDGRMVDRNGNVMIQSPHTGRFQPTGVQIPEMALQGTAPGAGPTAAMGAQRYPRQGLVQRLAQRIQAGRAPQ